MRTNTKSNFNKLIGIARARTIKISKVNDSTSSTSINKIPDNNSDAKQSEIKEAKERAQKQIRDEFIKAVRFAVLILPLRLDNFISSCG